MHLAFQHDSGQALDNQGRLYVVLARQYSLGHIAIVGGIYQISAYRRFYTTAFPATENPISQSASWINAGTTGLDWTDIRTTAGLAYGTQTGHSSSPPYNDSIAILTGAWGPRQTVFGTVKTINQKTGSGPSDTYEEVELWLRASISANRATGYEINFRCLKDGSNTWYQGVGRWNGPLNDFTDLDPGGAIGPGIADGDVVMAAITGNLITIHINGTYLKTVDVTGQGGAIHTVGAPGLGHWYQGTTGALDDYGFTSYTAMSE